MADKESTFTIKTGVIITLTGGLILFILQALLSHERRLTVVETNSSTIISMLSEIRGDLKKHLEETREGHNGK